MSFRTEVQVNKKYLFVNGIHSVNRIEISDRFAAMILVSSNATTVIVTEMMMIESPFTSSDCDDAARSLPNQLHRLFTVLLHTAFATVTLLFVAGGSLCDRFKSDVTAIPESHRNRVTVAVCKWTLTRVATAQGKQRKPRIWMFIFPDGEFV